MLEDLLGWEENRTLRAALAALRDIGNSCGLKNSSGFVIPHTHLMEGEPLNETFIDLKIFASFSSGVLRALAGNPQEAEVLVSPEGHTDQTAVQS